MNIFDIFYAARNEENAKEMAAYMKNKFKFLGIPKPLRANLSKDFFKQCRNDKFIDWNFVFKCFDMHKREFQYLAIDYIIIMKNLLMPEDIYKIENLILKKSWWDTTHSLDSVVGYMCLTYPYLKEEVIAKWINSDNIWLKRVSIDFQLKYKDKTDVNFLSKAILSNCNTNEFFINKAIGWSLREYSKTNKEWVKEFLKNNKLHSLSVREASKYL